MNLYSTPNIDRVMKSRRAGHVARMGEACTGFWWGNLKEGDHLGDPGVDMRIILRWVFRKWDVGVMGWIEVAPDRESWRTLVNAVMNIRVP